MALVFYHRGNAARPDMKMFRLGIQKAREAIENAIGGTGFVSSSSPSCFKTEESAKFH